MNRNLPPYLVPDSTALLDTMHLIKQLVYSAKFIIIIPLCGNVMSYNSSYLRWRPSTEYGEPRRNNINQTICCHVYEYYLWIDSWKFCSIKSDIMLFPYIICLCNTPACILLSCGLSSSFSCSHWSAGLNEEGEWERQRCDTMAWSWIQKRKYVSLEMLFWTRGINRPCVYAVRTLCVHSPYPVCTLIVPCIYTGLAIELQFSPLVWLTIDKNCCQPTCDRVVMK